MSERCRVLLLGVGGAGTHAVAHLRGRWSALPECAAVHTSAAVLAASGLTRTLAVGAAVCGGLSSGGDPEVGRRAAEADEAALRELVSDTDLVLLVAGLGGGTGGGAAPVVSRLARECGALTLAFCTLPFFFEGPQRRQRAEESLARLREAADAVVVLPNQRVLEWIDQNAELAAAFRQVDEALGTSIRALWRLLSQTGLINLDFADVRKLVQAGGGTLAVASAEAEGADRERVVVERLAASPLLDHGAVVAAAGGLLVGIIGGPDMTLTELQRIMTAVTGMARADVELHIGTAVDQEYLGRISITIAATEPATPEAPEPERKPGRALTRAKPEPPPPEGEAPAATPARPRPGGRAVQADLPLDQANKGRFRGAEPTIHDGQDLDQPTYLRRGIRLSKP